MHSFEDYNPRRVSQKAIRTVLLLEVKAQLYKYFETEGITSNDIIIDSLHNPDLSHIVVGYATSYKLKKEWCLPRSILLMLGKCCSL